MRRFVRKMTVPFLVFSAIGFFSLVVVGCFNPVNPDDTDTDATPGGVGGGGGGGTGEESDPYLIETASQLDRVREALDKHYRIIADIDLDGFGGEDGWVPIGSLDEPFTGSLDGGDHELRNLTIIDDGNLNRDVGLFGYTKEATISNVILTDVDVEGWMPVGGLVGTSEETEIDNCSVTGTVRGSQDVGGLVGRMLGGTVSNSFSEGTVTGLSDSGGANNAGGLIGNNEGGSISYSWSSATLDLIGRTGNRVGGLVGRSSGVDVLIERSYATGNVQGNMSAPEGVQYYGGLVGSLWEGTIRESYATGNVTALQYVGGFAGRTDGGANNTIEIENCYSTGSANAPRGYVGGFVGSHCRGVIRHSYSLGNVPSAAGSQFGGPQSGGFRGTSSSSGTFSRCYFDNDITERAYMGQTDLARTTLQMQRGTPGVYLNADGTVDDRDTPWTNNLMYGVGDTLWSTDIWDFGSDTDYPVLRWQSE